jgi:hypothetical protein
MTARDHSKLLGIFFLIIGGLGTLGGLLIGVGYGLFGLFLGLASGKPEGLVVGGVFVVIAIVIGLLILALSGLHLMSGWKLYKGDQSAKGWATISSILVLLSFPLGTALGIYGLWFLFGDQGKAFFSGNDFGNHPPPPTVPPGPQNWQ